MLGRVVVWLGSSLRDLRSFPREVRRAAGYQLERVQRGEMPSDWKAMGTIASGVFEIRLHVRAEHRILYVAKFAEAIYVLHVFEKKTFQTRQGDLDLAKSRYAELLTQRTRRGK